MSRYGFSAEERWGVFNAHNRKCYLCGSPLDLKTMQVDHVLPERLEDDPAELAKILLEYGLPKDFRLNSFSNWLPACAPCNNAKSGKPFRPVPIILVCVERAMSMAKEAEEIANQVVNDRSITRALNIVQRAVNANEIQLKDIEPLITKFFQLNKEAQEAQSRPAPPPGVIELRKAAPELRLTPFYKVLFEREGRRIIQTPIGIGYVPTMANPHSSFYCGHCGSLGPWDGIRCMSCGMLDDPGD